MKVNVEELRAFGEKQLPKSYMTNYGYSSHDDDVNANRGKVKIKGYAIPTRFSKTKRRAE